MARVTLERNGITYVYESTSYYDKEKKQSRSKRKLIGKLDPDTGEIVPTGKVGRPRKTAVSGNPSAVEEELRGVLAKTRAANRHLEERIRQQEEEISSLKAGNRELTRAISGLIRAADVLEQQLQPFRK